MAKNLSAHACEPDQARLRPQVGVPHCGAQLHAELPARARKRAVRRAAGGVHQPVRPRALLGAPLEPRAVGVRAASKSAQCSFEQAKFCPCRTQYPMPHFLSHPPEWRVTAHCVAL